MYGEHIEEMFKLFKENNPRGTKFDPTDIAEEVIGILYDQGQIDNATADDPEFLKQMVNDVKYICNL